MAIYVNISCSFELCKNNNWKETGRDTRDNSAERMKFGWHKIHAKFIQYT